MSSRERLPDHLSRMGIDVWTPRMAPPFGPAEVNAELALGAASQEITASANPAQLTASRQSGMEQQSEAPLAQAFDPVIEMDSPVMAMDWRELEQTVSDCVRCPLHQTRTQTVFGVGDRSARWMIVGEAPGEQEDLQGEPFVGRAGLLLNEMILSVGFSRQDVYIANVLKCRPPKNRDPSPDEAKACESYLDAQLALVKPVIILALGRIAAQNLLKTTTPIGKLRGEVHRYQNIPLVVTYHPAYLLRSQTEKRRAWDDLKLAQRVYREHI